MTDNRFLLLPSTGVQKFFLLQGNGGKIIIGQGDGVGSGGAGSSKQIGQSVVKKQLGDRPVIIARSTALGTMLVKDLYNVAHSKIVIPIYLHNECKVLEYPRIEGNVHCNMILSGSFYNISKSKINEEIAMIGKTVLSDMWLQVKSLIRFDIPTINKLTQARKEISQLKTQNKKNKLLELHRILTEDLRKAPSIQVDLNETIHQRGDLMRITANMSAQTGAIYMRIIDSKGIIVQKAGLVKKNATGFQILTGTRDLKSGKYFVQVSNHDNFSPLGVAEFQVKGDAPILPFIPVIPFLLTPDSPTGKFTKFIFRTMQDSRVDAICKKAENKKFKFSDKDAPIPPLHFNCRCWVEGIEEDE